MRKLALRFTVCLAALAATNAAHAEANRTGIWIGNSGNVGLEITKCGDSLCGRLVRLKDGADNASCGTPASNAKLAGRDRAAKPDTESNTFGDALKFLTDMGSMLFSDSIDWKPAGRDVKKCDDAAARAPASPAAVDKKAAPTPVAYAQPKAPAETPKAPITKITAPVKPTIQEPVREATRIASQPAKGFNCKKYFSQIGETILVPCE